MYEWLQRYTFSLENVWKIMKMRMKKKKVAEKFGGARKKQYLLNRHCFQRSLFLHSGHTPLMTKETE